MINDVTEVPLYRSGERVAYALIDGDDAERVLSRIWRLHEQGYAVSSLRSEGGATLSMHRFVMGLKQGDGLVVDHIDRDPLNNRKSNLRIVTIAQNHQNRASVTGIGTSKHRNVSWTGSKWRVRLTVGGQLISIGCFEDEDAAAEVASIARAMLMPFSEDADSAFGRVIRAVEDEIPNERQIIQWSVEGDDAARIVRLTELCGDVAAAIARGHTDVAGELTKLLAATTIWLESLSQR
jgi:hypothetical protein